MNKFKIMTAILLTIVIISLLACNKDDAEDIFAFDPTTQPTLAPLITPQPEGSGKIVVAIPSEIESTNPFLVNSRDLRSLYNLIFEPLIKFNEIGEPIPVLAQTWQQDETGKKWTITIRDDVYWQHSGRKLDAYDIEFTLDLMKQIKDDSDFCESLGYIRYWSIEDASTIKIYSYEPFYGTLNALDFPILPYDAGYGVDSEPLYPIGTGPYQVAAWKPGTEVVLQLNPEWWQKTPSIGTIIAQPYDDNSIAISALQLNQMDVVQTDEITLIASEQSREIFTYEYTTRYYEYLMPNLRSVLLGDERIRQAIAYALDRNEIVSNVYINHAILVDTPVPPTSYLYTGKLLTYDNDVEEARRLLKLAGWKNTDDDPWLDVSPDGLEIDFTLILLTNNDNENPQRYEAAHFIARQLEQVGIKVEVKAEEWDVFQNMVKESRFDLLLAGWYLNDIPDLRFMLKSDGSKNISGYTDVVMDELLQDIMNQKTREGLTASFDILQQKIIDDLPIISLYFKTHTLLTRNNILNISQITEDNAYSSIQYWTLR